MIENKKKNTFNSVFEIDETYENNSWLRVKIRTFAFGKNRNGSDILDSSLTNFTKARNSVGAVPIVAKYNGESDNLEGHNVTLRKNKDDEYEIFHDTDALGFTSPTANFYLEEVNEGTEAQPDYKTYVVIEDVYLWKRFDATKRIIEWFAEGTIPSVSMEIDEVEGQFDSDGYFQIQDFSFIGIAALGTDVEPCFKKAEIQMYTANEFRSDLKTLMSELNSYSENKGGNENMAKEQKEKVVSDYEKVEQPTSTLDMFTAEEFAEAIEMNIAFDTNINSDNSTIDSDDTNLIDETKVETTTEDAESTENNSEDVPDDSSKVEEDTTDFEVKFNELSTEYTSLQSEHETLKTELAELQAYKRQTEESEIKAKFEGKLSNEEFAQVFTEMKDSELDKVEEKLFALIGKKNFSIQSLTSTNSNKVTIVSPTKETYKPYGDLLD